MTFLSLAIVFGLAILAGYFGWSYLHVRKQMKTMSRVATARGENHVLVEQLRFVGDQLALVSYHRAPVENEWYGNLTRDDIEVIRAVVRDAGKALGA